MSNHRLFRVINCCLATSLLMGLVANEAFAQQADRQGRIYRWTSDKIQLDGPIPQDLPIEGMLVGGEAQIAAEKRLVASLAKKGSLEVIEACLVNVAAHLTNMFEVPVVIDNRSLEERGIGLDTPITLNVKDVSRRSLLDQVVRQLELEWIVRGDSLVITSRPEAEKALETRVYVVQDLVLVKRGDYYTRESESLLTTIKDTIAVESWADVGGIASARGLGDSLVISQTREVHEQIAHLLKTLRVARKLQTPTIETRTKVYSPRLPGALAVDISREAA